MKNPILSLLVLIAIFICGCNKKDVDNTGKSHATLTKIYINYDGVPRSVPVTGYAVHFTSDASGAASYKWDFGDGNKSTAPYPDHVYQKDGNYTVKLKLDNDDSVTATTSVTVVAVPTITAAFAGKHTWHVYSYSHVAGADKRDTGFSDMEIKYVDPVTIDFDNAKFYFQSSVTSGSVTVVKYRWFNGALGAHEEYDMSITHTALIDSFYCEESSAPSLGEYYSTTYISH